MKITKYRKDSDVSYALGATVTMEYLNFNITNVEAVILHPDFRSEETISKINSLCSEHNIPVSIEEKPFNILSQKENCFVIGVIKKHFYQLEKGNHIVLVNPSNAGNMGTIIRSAVAFGVKNIAVVTPAVDPFDPKTIRASMGASAKVNIQMFDSFDKYSEVFPDNNFYPFMLTGSTKLQNTHIKAPFRLIMGNEATGLPDSFSQIGQPIRIEHLNTVDSLNLPIATSIALFSATSEFFAE